MRTSRQWQREGRSKGRTAGSRTGRWRIVWWSFSAKMKCCGTHRRQTTETRRRGNGYSRPPPPPRAAAEERVDVDEFADPVPVVERQPTPALSVSSDMETLQRKAKERGEMMTMLREQLPPPEQVTERSTYAAYVKSVLCQGLSPCPERLQQGPEALLRVGFNRRRQ
ncbi:hypothetical protein NHX12_011218 [Muraenolepis orangiensis]|uniref:Uncharacterized protein n=1 Tax=Muraenolepis orangiensis TaxID=630683 RepID=A0A9Q0I8L0_9TELE|nr:hypothetical protein NHX12_011218 [Muraenolepis orangiensis]